ncbi:hypothetical protein TCAL_10621 [Tigriopus californicus]|uniref:SNF-related serine/threonine-protein kinase n=1 Tax=Tigriopus californicus TaxID=6832 RepID=A0A553PGW3_TIGCA|nr:SNF-related serine/threonine-protein kinase-like [Tigriopus californicus]XP_059082632.1 SNF-related serine/threonine-protein kinase-like [Tigriopus californicus]XP_059082633.1 SNF-related serine/threonine-protein kinase-like [Tigriopus californicus]TRY76929.1 hypothetical protein TCAL_10621 [Tigriopus californicus]|eukprot:TCALIF_10621-PA protein Name:"Similar to SNRK SNF-related serine/threonine-protein kinase (Homo sapiens)" AED:0.02 eAED:0.02 QI:880/1/1/1/0.8/0.66/6/808/1091
MERQAHPRNRIGGTVSSITTPKRQIAGLYDLEETLGEGHYAVVKLASHVFTGEKVAVKVIDKTKLDAATKIQMLQEVQLMKLVQHPHVVRLYEVIDTQTKLYLILEYADGGDMYDYIMKHEGGLSEDQARTYFKQIVTAIQYCHRLHVVHRDLKPENVVFFEKLGIVKLTDFGFSNQFNPGQRLETSCGSLAYSAPEILLGDAYDAPAVDIWSLGVILYMLVCGSAPFQEANDSETLTMIMDCKYTFPKHISSQCRSLISRMLQRNPDARSSLMDIVEDPWLGGGADEEGNAIPTIQQLPLVSREHLTEEEHAYILKKMESGKIAPRDEIIHSLDMNEYNHITATYFLLAERKLRTQRADLACRMSRSDGGSAAFSLDEKPLVSVASSVPLSQSLDFRSGPPNVFLEKPSPMVDSLLSPESDIAPVSSSSPNRRRLNKLRNISIVEEEDERDSADEGIKMIPLDPANKVLSHHSSTSSLADKPLVVGSPKSHAFDIGVLAASLRSQLSMTGVGGGDITPSANPPTPFPVSSQIGTGGLSRQGSLRRVDTGPASASPASDRKSIPSSPSTPPGSNGSSNQNSPARFKMAKKLVSTRSSPQLLNQIHEEAEDSSGSRTASLRFLEEDPVDSFPSSAAGVAVIRRLEARRKLHKARAQSCSSSDASDDDSESKKKRHEKSRTPPYNIPRRRDSQHDDSSDSQEPGMGGATSAAAFRAQQASSSSGIAAGSSQGKSDNTEAGSRGRNSTSSSNANNNTASRSVAHLSRRHRSNATSRIRQSHSLNRISELHVVADFSSDHDDISNNNSSCPSSVASVVNGVYYPKPPSLLQHQLISENDSEGGRFDMLTRYLESLSAHRSNNGSSTIRSRDDSQNSSDGEFDADLSTRSSSSRTRHKVNLRVLEQRLNKIQEECNKSADEEEGEVDEEMGELSDDVATLPDDSLDPRQDMLDALENARNLQGSKDDDQENEHSIVSRTILEIYDPKKYTRRDSDPDETGSTKSCFTTVMSRVSQKPRKPLHRAHSCGSLMGLKERALLSKNLPVIWDILKAANARGSASTQVSSQGEFSLQLAAATNPITTMFQIQSTSRCCNLC